MKILQVNTTLNSGSTGRIVEDIGLKVLQKGDEVFIAAARIADGSRFKPIKLGNRLDHANHLIQTRLFDTHGFHSARATRELISAIKPINPDIIHLHNLHGYYLNIKILFQYLKYSGIPVVWTLHDCWPFTGHCCYFERANCKKWTTECNNCPLKYLYPKSLIRDNSRGNYNKKKELFTLPKKIRIVTVSKWLEEYVKFSFLKKFNIQTIYNGVDLSVFKPLNQEKLKEKYDLAGKQVLIGVANVWSEGKGLDTFIELSKNIDNNHRIILVGLNQHQMKNLPANIRGVMHTKSTEELTEYYNMADVLVIPSIAETFGMVAVEAMACGTPSVVFNSGALSEVVTEKTGIIVPYNDTGKLLQAIKALLTIGRRAYVDNCRSRAAENFDKDLQNEKYYQLYKNLLS